MQTVDEKPETIHLYVVREENIRPPIFPIVLSVLALSVLVAFCALTPYQQPVTRAVIRVPAVLLPIRTFTVTTAIVPTGVKVYPATTAHGILTITNGSIIGQSIPAGFTIQSVTTDSAVYVPPGNANGYGWVQVEAHALVSGKGGNFATLAINQVIGSSLYIRNLTPFYGGHNAYTVKFITSNDRSVALSKARTILISKATGLHYPCTEYVNNKNLYVNIYVNWRCQLLTYHIPSYMHVSNVQLIGTNFLLSVWYIEHPKHYWAK
jgi:hypothetical protein